MAELKQQLSKKIITDIDTNEFQFILTIYTTSEQHVRGYIATDKQNNVLVTKFFMNYKTATEVIHEIKKELRKTGYLKLPK